MNKDAKILKRSSSDDFTSGIPNKKSPKDSMINKAYSLGYQQAALVNGMQALAKQQSDQQQQYAQAVQQLFQLQAQLAQQQQAGSAMGQLATLSSGSTPLPGVASATAMPGSAAIPTPSMSLPASSPAGGQPPMM